MTFTAGLITGAAIGSCLGFIIAAMLCAAKEG